MSHRWTDVKELWGKMKHCWYILFSVCPYWQGFPDYFKVWVKINELIVYQESIYLKESEIGKAIFSLCTKVSCVMQLAMTTKLMALCSQSQWVWSRPNTWIKCYTWCPTTSLECEVHPHFISQSQWLTFIYCTAYITGWLSKTLITHGLWSSQCKTEFPHNFLCTCTCIKMILVHNLALIFT